MGDALDMQLDIKVNDWDTLNEAFESIKSPQASPQNQKKKLEPILSYLKKNNPEKGLTQQGAALPSLKDVTNCSDLFYRVRDGMYSGPSDVEIKVDLEAIMDDLTTRWNDNTLIKSLMKHLKESKFQFDPKAYADAVGEFKSSFHFIGHARENQKKLWGSFFNSFFHHPFKNDNKKLGEFLKLVGPNIIFPNAYLKDIEARRKRYSISISRYYDVLNYVSEIKKKLKSLDSSSETLTRKQAAASKTSDDEDGSTDSEKGKEITDESGGEEKQQAGEDIDKSDDGEGDKSGAEENGDEDDKDDGKDKSGGEENGDKDDKDDEKDKSGAEEEEEEEEEKPKRKRGRPPKKKKAPPKSTPNKKKSNLKEKSPDKEETPSVKKKPGRKKKVTLVTPVDELDQTIDTEDDEQPLKKPAIRGVAKKRTRSPKGSPSRSITRKKVNSPATLVKSPEATSPISISDDDDNDDNVKAKKTTTATRKSSRLASKNTPPQTPLSPTATKTTKRKLFSETTALGKKKQKSTTTIAKSPVESVTGKRKKRESSLLKLPFSSPPTTELTPSKLPFSSPPTTAKPKSSSQSSSSKTRALVVSKRSRVVTSARRPVIRSTTTRPVRSDDMMTTTSNVVKQRLKNFGDPETFLEAAEKTGSHDKAYELILQDSMGSDITAKKQRQVQMDLILGRFYPTMSVFVKEYGVNMMMSFLDEFLLEKVTSYVTEKIKEIKENRGKEEEREEEQPLRIEDSPVDKAPEKNTEVSPEKVTETSPEKKKTSKPATETPPKKRNPPPIVEDIEEEEEETYTGSQQIPYFTQEEFPSSNESVVKNPNVVTNSRKDETPPEPKILPPMNDGDDDEYDE